MDRLCIVLLLAMLIDRLFGDPQWLWNKIPHPVAVFGQSISYLERMFNRAELSFRRRYIYGVFTIVVLLAGTYIFTWLVQLWLQQLAWAGIVLEAIVASMFLAQKSLSDHVSRVEQAFQHGSLDEARRAVGMIVGRDTATLDESAICRAAIESLSENSSDGVIAPIFWFLLLGLPGLVCYKLLNTADSMIGHKNSRYLQFGWASARLDDLANYIPARLTALITILALLFWYGRSKALRAAMVVKQDARHHRSPNAGWPECAYAGGLGIQLAGPRLYGGHLVQEPFQNADGRVAQPTDINKAIRLFKQSMTLAFILLAAYLVLSSIS